MNTNSNTKPTSIICLKVKKKNIYINTYPSILSRDIYVLKIKIKIKIWNSILNKKCVI